MLLASAVYTLTCADQSWQNLGTQEGSPRYCGKVLLCGADTYPLAGTVPGCLEPEIRSAPEALWLLPVPEAVSLCSTHSHLSRPVSAESGNPSAFILDGINAFWLMVSANFLWDATTAIV